MTPRTVLIMYVLRFTEADSFQECSFEWIFLHEFLLYGK